MSYDLAGLVTTTTATQPDLAPGQLVRVRGFRPARSIFRVREVEWVPSTQRYVVHVGGPGRMEAGVWHREQTAAFRCFAADRIVKARPKGARP